MGKLYFRYGAMNCGKTTNLLQVAHNYEERGMKIIILKPKTDTKAADSVVSRLGLKKKVDLLITADMNVFNQIDKWQEERFKLDCILIDEVQFMKKEQIDQIFRIAVEMDIPVICYGLRTDFQVNGFEGSSRLLLLAHSIEELKTICSCGKKALLNARKVNGKFVFKGDQVVIDDNDNIEYEAVCPKCYFSLKKSER